MAEKCELYIKRIPLLAAIANLFDGEGIESLYRLYDTDNYFEYIRVVYRKGIILETKFGYKDTYLFGWYHPRVHYHIHTKVDFKLHCNLICSLIANTIKHHKGELKK